MRNTLPVELDAARRAFDKSALTYDDEFDATPAARRLRKVVGEILLQYFSPGNSILELNCGTGTDAVFLARHGINVHATDLSPQMIEMTREKVRVHDVAAAVSTDILAFDQLMSLAGGRLYDGVFSNMGGMNCTRDIASIAGSLASLVRPGGYAILGVMPDCTLLETLAFLIRGNTKSAFRRSHPEGCLAMLHGERVRTWYYSPGRVREVFSAHFVHTQTVGLNIFTPPPSSNRINNILGRSLIVFEKLDDLLCKTWPFNRIGDHYVIVLKRKADTVA